MSTAAHPEVETLAALIDGVLPPEDAVALRGHLAGCAACTAETASLRDALGHVAALLAAEPVPTMPADVAARLDAVLAAAPPLAPAPAGGAAAVAPDPVHAEPPLQGTVTTLPTVRRRSRGAWLGAAAASVLVLAGTGVFLGTQGRGSSDLATSAGATAAAPPATTVLASGTDYDPSLLDVAVPSLVGPTADAETARAYDSAGGATAPGPEAPREDASPEVPAPAVAGPTALQLTPGVAPAALTRLQDETALQGCLTELSGTPVTVPLALDYAAYEGAPALIVVLPGISPTRLDVFVVGPGCSPTQADLLVYRSVPR